MRKFRLIITIVLLIASLVILILKLFTPQPINITLESGQEVSTQSSDYFSLSQTLLLIVCSFVIGGSSVHLFYNSELQALSILPKRGGDEKYAEILPLLKEDERMIMKELIKNKGALMQNTLVSTFQISKVNAARIVMRLERKGLITKERAGFTNRIILKK